MTGGGGNDRFDFNSLNDSKVGGAVRDIITDFVQGADKIDLAGIDAITGGGDDAFTFIENSGFSNTAGELRFFTSGGNTIVNGDVDGDGTPDFQIQLDGLYALTAADFVL